MLNMTKRIQQLLPYFLNFTKPLFKKHLYYTYYRFNCFKASVTFDPLCSITSQSNRAGRGVWNGILTHANTHKHRLL